jgi:hypothetical protein
MLGRSNIHFKFSCNHTIFLFSLNEFPHEIEANGNFELHPHPRIVTHKLLTLIYITQHLPIIVACNQFTTYVILCKSSTQLAHVAVGELCA